MPRWRMQLQQLTNTLCCHLDALYTEDSKTNRVSEIWDWASLFVARTFVRQVSKCHFIMGNDSTAVPLMRAHPTYHWKRRNIYISVHRRSAWSSPPHARLRAVRAPQAAAEPPSRQPGGHPPVLYPIEPKSPAIARVTSVSPDQMATAGQRRVPAPCQRQTQRTPAVTLRLRARRGCLGAAR
jgi:hypothetical protein